MYPPTDLSTRPPSRDLFAHSSTFTDRNLRWALDNYIPAGTDLSDPLLSPLHGDVTDLPPAYIAGAGFDLLRDDAVLYADKLRAGGVPVTLSRQPDLPTPTSTSSASAAGSPKPPARPAPGCASASGSLTQLTQRRAGEFVGVGDIP
jgi:acetyl esterase